MNSILIFTKLRAELLDDKFFNCFSAFQCKIYPFSIVDALDEETGKDSL